MLTALLTFAANLRAAALDEMLAKRKPEARIDLGTKEGTELVKGQWRYSDTKIVEVDFKAAGADGQPSTTPNKTYDFTPQAGRAEFDDSEMGSDRSDQPRQTAHQRQARFQLVSHQASPFPSASATSIRPARRSSSHFARRLRRRSGSTANCRARRAKAAAR